MASGNLQDENIKIATNAYDRYMGLALPYIPRKSKIDVKTADVLNSKVEMMKIKEALAKAKTIAAKEIIKHKK